MTGFSSVSVLSNDTSPKGLLMVIRCSPGSLVNGQLIVKAKAIFIEPTEQIVIMESIGKSAA